MNIAGSVSRISPLINDKVVRIKFSLVEQGVRNMLIVIIGYYKGL